jgi:hypothetical protein
MLIPEKGVVDEKERRRTARNGRSTYSTLDSYFIKNKASFK